MIEKESLKISDTEYYNNSIERIANEANNSNEYAEKRLSPRELKTRLMRPAKLIREHFNALIELLDGLDSEGEITAESILGLIHTGIPSLPTLYDLVKAFPDGKIPDAIVTDAGKTLRSTISDVSEIQDWISKFMAALGVTVAENDKKVIYKLIEAGALDELLLMLKAYQSGELKGDPGVDGYSPTVTVSQTESGAEITVTDKAGVTTATIDNGKQGLPGKDGADGCSPSVTVTQTTDGAEITITDKEGTTTATLANGKDGKDGYSPKVTTVSDPNGVRLEITDENGVTKSTLIAHGKDGTDGTDGYSPVVSMKPIDDGVTLSITDRTGEVSTIIYNGTNGKDGKSAYELAQDSGYTGTEAEFSAKLAMPFVIPQLFGAKGDGVTDDTQAFLTALAASDNVYLPAGTYLITDTLDISYKQSIYSDAGQRATIIYGGNNPVVSIGRMSIFRNINITVQNAFVGAVFDTNNYNKNSGEPALSSRVEHVNVDFETESPEAALIGITVDSGTDANNIPRLTGVCFQTYHDIQVDNSSCAYGYGIKMELIQGRAFTEATKTGFPWITHIDFDDISLGHPHTAIKSTVTNTSGTSHFERISVGHILFNNVYSQFLDAESTQIFFDVDNFSGYATKCIGWDYHSLGWTGQKCNIIGENVSICLSDCEMAFGVDFLESCEFTAETEYTVANNPEYFMSKYFGGTVLRSGYDIVNAKIDAKLDGAYIGDIAEAKINEVLYSGYTNVLEDPLTQIKVDQRWSGSSKSWAASLVNTTVIIPIVEGGNIIRWTPSDFALATSYQYLYFFNTDTLDDGVQLAPWTDFWVSDGGYLQIDNPSGYKYVSIPFELYDNISSATMTMTINREITGSEGKSYTEYLKENVVDPAIDEAVGELVIPTKTSQLTNDSGFLTAVPSEYVTDTELTAKGYAVKSSAETWTFTLSDGSTVTKKVVLA